VYRKTGYAAMTTTWLDPAIGSARGGIIADLDGDGNEDNLIPRRLTDSPELALVSDLMMENKPGIWKGTQPHVMGSGVIGPHMNGTIPAGGNVAYLDGHAEWRNLRDMNNNLSYQGSLNDGLRDYYW
jgi:prepilin-type processing-associated H-X9-DG protein